MCGKLSAACVLLRTRSTFVLGKQCLGARDFWAFRRRLDISENAIGARGAAAIAEALVSPYSVSIVAYVDFTHCDIGGPLGVRALLCLLAASDRVKWLGAGENQLGDAFLTEFVPDVSSKNRTLGHLDMHSCNVWTAREAKWGLCSDGLTCSLGLKRLDSSRRL